MLHRSHVLRDIFCLWHMYVLQNRLQRPWYHFCILACRKYHCTIHSSFRVHNDPHHRVCQEGWSHTGLQIPIQDNYLHNIIVYGVHAELLPLLQEKLRVSRMENDQHNICCHKNQHSLVLVGVRAKKFPIFTALAIISLNLLFRTWI